MSEILPYIPASGLGSFGHPSRTDRAVSRELTRVSAGASIKLARVDAAAEIQAASADALAFVGRRAMQDVALLSQVETQLAQAVPHASGRLAMIADLTAIGLSEIVVDTARAIRRA